MAKKYSIIVENDVVVSVEVDGIQYNSPDQIPDPGDRAQILRLLSQSNNEAVNDDFGSSFDDDFGENRPQNFGKDFDAQFRELERQSANAPKIIVGVFLAVSLPMLAIATLLTVNTTRFLTKEKSAPGRVTDVVPRQSQPGKGPFYYPVIEFTLPNEKVQTVELSEGSRPPAYERGESVTILYDPAHPRNARIDSFSSTLLMWIGPVITGTVGIIFLVVALLVHRLLQPEMGKREQTGN